MCYGTSNTIAMMQVSQRESRAKVQEAREGKRDYKRSTWEFLCSQQYGLYNFNGQVASAAKRFHYLQMVSGARIGKDRVDKWKV